MSKMEAVEQSFQDVIELGQADASPFSLDAVTSSKAFSPLKVVVYGVPGIGKTTFASTFPKPILLRTEDGACALDVPTFPKVVANINDLRQATNSLLKSEHGYKTLVIDSLDWLEPLVWQDVCREHGKVNIEDFGYGKGYVLVDTKWQAIQAGLDMLREKKGMHIVCIAHAVAQTFDPPDSDPYARYTIKLHKRAASLWTEWAEMLLFLQYKSKVQKSQDGPKAKAIGKGERVIYTQERPAYIAKSRWPLPEEIFIGHDPMWAEFHAALNEASEGKYHN